jgi:hypothetical protein
MLSRVVATPSSVDVDSRIDVALPTGTAVFSIAAKPLE